VESVRRGELRAGVSGDRARWGEAQRPEAENDKAHSCFYGNAPFRLSAVVGRIASAAHPGVCCLIGFQSE